MKSTMLLRSIVRVLIAVNVSALLSAAASAQIATHSGLTAGQRFDAAGVGPAAYSTNSNFRTNAPATFGGPGLVQQFGPSPSQGSYNGWANSSNAPSYGNGFNTNFGNGPVSGFATWSSSVGGFGYSNYSRGWFARSGLNHTVLYPTPWPCYPSAWGTVGSYAVAPGYGSGYGYGYNYGAQWFPYGTGIFHPNWNNLTAWNPAPFGWTTDPWTGMSVPFNPACHPIVLGVGGVSNGIGSLWMNPTFVNVAVSFRPEPPGADSVSLTDPRLLGQLFPAAAVEPGGKLPRVAARANPVQPVVFEIPDAPPLPEPPLDAANGVGEVDAIPDVVVPADGIFLRGKHKHPQD